MSRLDQHVSRAQARLWLDLFVDSLARAAAVFLAVVLVGVLVNRALAYSVPRAGMTALIFGAAAVLVAALAALLRRPSRLDAAVAIDDRLGLRERFSSALVLRGVNDRFAMAAVSDAEMTAREVAVPVSRIFPIRFPRAAGWAATIAVVLMLALMLPQADWLGHRQQQEEARQATAVKTEQAQKAVKAALATVSALPAALQKVPAVQIAQQQLAQQAASGTDPASAQRTAAAALKDVENALQEQVKSNSRYAEAQKEKDGMRELANQPLDNNSPLASVQQAMAQGDLTKAMTDLNKVVANFDQMDKKDQQQVAADMQKLAAQLQQLADKPQAQQQMQQQLQQMGLSQQQAQQAQQLMQQAAAGNQAAQQQLQQMAKQAISQLQNSGQGAAAQQLQQMMNQMQAQANAQQRTGQMSQAAQQLAQAMQQAAQHGGTQHGAAQPKQGASQSQGQTQSSPSGMQSQSQGMSGLGQAGQSMQDAMGQMQAIQQDAQQMQAAQEAMAQGQEQAMDGLSPGGGEPGMDENNSGSGEDSKNQNNPNKNPSNQNGKNQGAGAHGTKEQAPYTVRPEFSPSQTNEKGRLLASTLVKAGALRGEKRQALKNVADAAAQDAPDEVDEDRVSRQAQDVVKEYFRSMQEDAQAAAAPADGQSAGPTTAPAGK